MPPRTSDLASTTFISSSRATCHAKGHFSLLSSRSRLSGAASVQAQPELVGSAGRRALRAACDHISMAIWGAWPAPTSCPTELAAVAGRRRREQSLGSTSRCLPTALLRFIFKKRSGATSPLLGQAMKQPPHVDPPLQSGIKSCPRQDAAGPRRGSKAAACSWSGDRVQTFPYEAGVC